MVTTLRLGSFTKNFVKNQHKYRRTKAPSYKIQIVRGVERISQPHAGWNDS